MSRREVQVGFDELIGREREAEQLSDLIARGLSGGAVEVLTGDPGIGKSALLGAVRNTAVSAGFTVLTAVGFENEMHLPFGGLHQILAPLMDELHNLPRVQRTALLTAFGLIPGTRPDLFLIAEGAVALLAGRRRTAGPLLVTVDDAQWLDPQSHQVVAFLAHRSASAHYCLVAALRRDHPSPFLDGGFATLLIEGVDESSAEQILRRSNTGLGRQEALRIAGTALGNPLALLELPGAWGEGPPTDDHPLTLSARLERAFAGRVAALPADTRDALLIAAAGSSSSLAEALAAMVAFGVAAPTASLLAPAHTAGLVALDTDSVVFRHPLVRSGVLQREPLSRRHLAHAALARTLTGDNYRRAWHRAWSTVGPDNEAADALASTVADFLQRGAVMTAVSSLERAAQLTSDSPARGHRLMQAANHAFSVGRADVVTRILREAAQVDLADLDQVRLTWLSEALNEDVRPDSQRVRRLCDASREADRLGDSTLALDLVMGAALRVWWADSGPHDRARVLHALDLLRHLRGDPRHLAAMSIAEPVLKGAEVAAVLEAAALEAIADGDLLRTFGMAAYGVGDFALTTDLLDRAEQAFRAQGRLGMLPVVLALQLHIRLDMGDWAGAAAAGAEVSAVATETGQAVFADNNVLVEARGLALRGAWREALELMAGAEAEATRLRLTDRVCLAYQARGAALLSAGRAEEAFECLRRQYDPDDVGYHLRESFGGVALLAEAADQCGRSAEGRDIVESLELVAVLTSSPLLNINLLLARALLAPEGARERLFLQGLGQDLQRWPWLRSRLELEYGRWLCASGRCAEGVQRLQAARTVFDGIGARRWSERASEALRLHDDHEQAVSRVDDRP